MRRKHILVSLKIYENKVGGLFFLQFNILPLPRRIIKKNENLLPNEYVFFKKKITGSGFSSTHSDLAFVLAKPWGDGEKPPSVTWLLGIVV